MLLYIIIFIIINPGVGKVWTAGQILPPLAPVHVLLEHSYTHLFMYCLWLPWPYDGKVEWLQQWLYNLKSWKYLLYGSLQKNFTDFRFNQSSICWMYRSFLILYLKNNAVMNIFVSPSLCVHTLSSGWILRNRTADH